MMELCHCRWIKLASFEKWFHLNIWLWGLNSSLDYFINLFMHSLGGQQYHLGRGHIGTSMKANLYNLLEHRAANWYHTIWSFFVDEFSFLISYCSNFYYFCSRYFVIPLWRGSGYATMFAQGLFFVNDYFFLTSIIVGGFLQILD